MELRPYQLAAVDQSRHKVTAGARRYDEMRERRLSPHEKEAAASSLLDGIARAIEANDAERARANARAIVRLMR